MLTEDISDLVKSGVAFGLPATSFMGVPLQDWMYYTSIFAAVLLILERTPAALKGIQLMARRVYARVKE